MLLRNTMHVLIEGDPFLSRARLHAAAVEEFELAWDGFREKHGSCCVAPGCNGLLFDGKAPEGWTRREGRGGFSRPRAGTPAAKAMAALPKRPKAWDVFGDGLLYEVVYEHEGATFHVPACELWEGPNVGWALDTFFAQVPDPVAAAAELADRFPGMKVLNGAGRWEPPAGLMRVGESQLQAIISGRMREIDRDISGAC